MNIRDISEGCKGCPNIEPYVHDIRRIEQKLAGIAVFEKQPDIYPPEAVAITKAEYEMDMRESENALADASVRTIGCPGTEKYECQSPLEVGG